MMITASADGCIELQLTTAQLELCYITRTKRKFGLKPKPAWHWNAGTQVLTVGDSSRVYDL